MGAGFGPGCGLGSAGARVRTCPPTHAVRSALRPAQGRVRAEVKARARARARGRGRVRVRVRVRARVRGQG